jgi:two-component system, OmpR family, phosphate regulon sensor histidine kinase PhoR
MYNFGTTALLFNGLTLSLALGFLIIILWYDVRRSINQLFGLFLFFLLTWNMGAFLLQFNTLSLQSVILADVSISALEAGFVGTSLMLYLLSSDLVGIQQRNARNLAFLSVFILLLYRFLLIVIQPQMNLSDRVQLQPLFVIFCVFFNIVSLFVIWRYRRKLQSQILILGGSIFCLGQFLVIANNSIDIVTISTALAGVGALFISFSLIRSQIILPLSEQSTQVATFHHVGLAISSQLSLDTVLDEIAIQAVRWAKADASGIFLRDDNKQLILETVHNLPEQIVGLKIQSGEGVSGYVFATEKPIYIENYNRDWHGADEILLARQTFGSLIGIPLIYAEQVIGVLVVIAGRQSVMLDRDDVRLLEMLGAQAAVAISHSRLFKEQIQLVEEVQTARNQLEAVLSGTDNPVIAVDRNFLVIFANLAAMSLFDIGQGDDIVSTLPVNLVPDDRLSIIKQMLKDRRYTQEISYRDKVFMCHIAALGDEEIIGWVAVLNDITELKELDRLKSEMVRMASHDLKNPLMGALTYIDLLRDEMPKEDTDTDGLHTVDVIEQQLERMNRIIRGILDIEQVAMLVTRDEYIVPSDIIQAAIKELAHYIDDHGVEIAVNIEPGLPEFMGNAKQLERMLVNLIENAVKFSLEVGLVSVDVRQIDGNIVYSVKDAGVGIPKEIQDRVFERFFRGNQEAVSHITGTGLGLSIVKTIVDAHDGEIKIDSLPGMGTTFSVFLPVYSHSHKRKN